MNHKVTNKEREYILKVLNETLEYENEEKFEVEYTLMAIAKMIEASVFITKKEISKVLLIERKNGRLSTNDS